MKTKKIGHVILVIFTISLITIPFAFTSSVRIGIDPEDDVLEVKLLDLDNMKDWLDSNYFSKRDPDFKWLYELDNDWFKTEDGPDCIDIVKWGLVNYGSGNSSIFIEVKDIIDYIDSEFFQIDILIVYKDAANNEEIQWFGEIEYEDDDITDNDFKTDFNYGSANSSSMTGDVDIHKVNNTYEIYFDTTWMTEIDDDVIVDNMYGLVFGYSFNTTTRANVTATFFDFLPNSYYGQSGSIEDSNTGSTIELADTILFAGVVLAFLIIIFLIVAFYNRGRKGGRSKRTGRTY